MRKAVVLLSLMILGISVVKADVPPVKRTQLSVKESSATIGFHTRSERQEPTLTIKRSALKQLRAAIDEADDSSTYAESEESNSVSPRTPMIIAGAFFSLAFVFGGVWMFRVKGKNSKIAASLIIIALLGAGVSVVYANTPPPWAIDLTSRLFSKSAKAYNLARGKIKVRIIDDNRQQTDFYLEIPKDDSDPDLK